MTTNRSETWRVDAGEADVALLRVPPVLRLDRVFEIDLRFVVRTPAQPGAWLEVTLELDGAREWSRRIDATCLGQTDSLDFHCRRALPAGRDLRLRATTRVGGGARRSALSLAAEASDGA